MTVRDHLHIPDVGDHYSPRTGSAIPTIINRMVVPHERRGGRAFVLAQAGTMRGYEQGEVVDYAGGFMLTRGQRLVDAVRSRLGGIHLNRIASYAGAIEALPRAFDGDILLHNQPAPGPEFARRAPNARVFLWCNNELFRTYGARELKRLARGIAGIICCSEYIRRTLPARLRSAARSVTIVRNGADLDQFRPKLERVGGTDSPTHILFVGRMHPFKGPHVLLKALTRLRSEGIPFLATCVGSRGFDANQSLSKYERQCRDLGAGLGGDVRFMPFQERSAIPELLRSADVFCVPSTWPDPCPLTVAEGLASGLAVAASRIGGIPELGGEAAKYFPAGDDRALADVLRLFCTDRALRESYGRLARERAEAELSWDHRYQQLLRAVET